MGHAGSRLSPHDRGVKTALGGDGDWTAQTGLAVAEETTKKGILTVNESMEFDLSLAFSFVCDRAGFEALAADIPTRRCFKKGGGAQIKAIIRLGEVTDLTTLGGADNWVNVVRLCRKGGQPFPQPLLDKYGIDRPVRVGAICVYPAQVEAAVAALQGTGIPVASVATGFPDGQTFQDLKLIEIDRAIKAGAIEIDVVIPRELALLGKWRELYNVLVEFRNVCGKRAHLKVIIETCNLPFDIVGPVTAIAILAGADFVKTSTGKGSAGATLSSGLVMMHVISEFFYTVNPGRKVGFKAAGGLREAKTGFTWLAAMEHELPEGWTTSHLSRIGASGWVIDLAMQLSHQIDGIYDAPEYHPLG